MMISICFACGRSKSLWYLHDGNKGNVETEEDGVSLPSNCIYHDGCELYDSVIEDLTACHLRKHLNG